MTVRVVVVEDNLLVRSGLTAVLKEVGCDVVGTYHDAEHASEDAAWIVTQADLAVLDIRLPPTQTIEGIQLAATLRLRRPAFAVVLVSQHVETTQLSGLLESPHGGIGYLLKDRVLDLDAFGSTLRAVHDGEIRLDPTVVAALMGRPRVHNPLDKLTAREHDVLALMAEGLTNTGIAHALTLSIRTVESHVAAVFTRFALTSEKESHRRVRAVVTYLRSTE